MRMSDYISVLLCAVALVAAARTVSAKEVMTRVAAVAQITRKT